MKYGTQMFDRRDGCTHLKGGDVFVHIKCSSSGCLGECAPPILEGYD